MTLRILIVEDEMISAHGTRVILTRLGYEVAGIVASGESAIEMAIKIEPDLILMDIHLDGKIDGIEAATQIQKRRQIPIVYTTAFCDEETLRRAKLTSPSGYICKPIDEQSLQVVLELAFHNQAIDRKLKDSEAHYRTLFESNPHPMWVYDPKTLSFLDVNESATWLYGYSREQFLNLTITDIHVMEDNPTWMKNVACQSPGVDKVGTYRHKKKDGTVIEVELISHSLEYGGRHAGLVLVNDITERKRAEREIGRLNRLCCVRSEVNRAIVRCSSREELFPIVCNICIRFGNFKAAWIGWLDPQTQLTSPVAFSENLRGYLSQSQVRAEQRTENHEPADAALREGRTVICNILKDPCNLPWHQGAAIGELHSAAAFPIRTGDAACGALTLYANEEGIFNDKEVVLLEEIAGDISYSLDNMEKEAQRIKVENALRENEARFRAVFEHSLDAIYRRDLQADRYDYMSPGVERLVGFTVAEMIGMDTDTLLKHIHPDDLPHVMKGIRDSEAGSDGTNTLEYRFKGKTGRFHWLADHFTVVKDNASGQPAYRVGRVRSITEQHAEQR